MPRGGPFILAGLLAVNLPAHVLYLGWVPGRAGWWLLWAGLTVLLYPTVKWTWPRLGRLLWTAGPAAVFGPVVVGAALAGWWHDELMDVLWLHGQRGRNTLLPVMHLGHVAVGTAAVALGTAALIATDPPPGPASSQRPPTAWEVLAGFILAAGLFAVWYVGQERAVYPADYMYYWDRAADWGGRLRADHVAGADELRRSVQRDTYTLLPVLPHGLAMAALGDSRLVFVLSTTLAYLPQLVCAGIAYVRLSATDRTVSWVVALAVGLFPGTWLPVLRGYPDVGGVGLAVATLVVYLHRPAGRLRWHHLFALIALLVGLTLFRRWYAFWVVAFGLMVAADGLAAAASHALTRRWRDFAQCLRPAAALAVLLPLCLAAVALPGARQMASGDFAGAFAGYKADLPFTARLAELTRAIGPAYVGGAVVSAIGLALGPARRPALFVAGMVPVMVAHFMRVQDFNPHHQYLLLPAITLLPAAAAARLPKRVWVPLAAVGVALMAPAFTSVPAGWQSWAECLGSAANGRPLRRHDMDEFRRLAKYLNEQPADERFVVLASSLDMHTGMVASLGRTLRQPFPAADRQLTLQEVDRVNGFPTSVFIADMVLVADPPQIHMRPEEQQTLLLPARELLAGTGVGAAFDRLPDAFSFDGGVILRVYRRARPVSPDALAALVESLRQTHPARPTVFSPPAQIRMD